MLKIDMADGHANICYDGDPLDVAAHLGAAISGIAQSMEMDGKAELFCSAIRMIVNEPELLRHKLDMTRIAIPKNK